MVKNKVLPGIKNLSKIFTITVAYHATYPIQDFGVGITKNGDNLIGTVGWTFSCKRVKMKKNK